MATLYGLALFRYIFGFRKTAIVFDTKMKILVTGASGFVGHALCNQAVEQGLTVRAAKRLCSGTDELIESVAIGDIDGNTDWSEALRGCGAVLHLAARVHIMSDTAIAPLAEFRKVNVDGTLNLARQAAKAGVGRFVFVSSIKVNGEGTQLGQPFTADDVAAPKDAYGISKAEAEEGLRELSEETGIEVVIIRPPLVYGPGVKGNLSSIIRWLSNGWLLPLGAVTRNRRSFVALDNLIDLILTCVEHPQAVNQTFLVSDGEDLSTAELLLRMGKALNRPARLASVPAGLLDFAARLLGKRDVSQRLLGSLQIDINRTCELLNWKPPVSVNEGMRRLVEKNV